MQGLFLLCVVKRYDGSLMNGWAFIVVFKKSNKWKIRPVFHILRPDVVIYPECWNFTCARQCCFTQLYSVFGIPLLYDFIHGEIRPVIWRINSFSIFQMQWKNPEGFDHMFNGILFEMTLTVPMWSFQLFHCTDFKKTIGGCSRGFHWKWNMAVQPKGKYW